MAWTCSLYTEDFPESKEDGRNTLSWIIRKQNVRMGGGWNLLRNILCGGLFISVETFTSSTSKWVNSLQE
jgi:hypothetical protein